jgi:hypothetical protein
VLESGAEIPQARQPAKGHPAKLEREALGARYGPEEAVVLRRRLPGAQVVDLGEGVLGRQCCEVINEGVFLPSYW